MPVRRSLPRWLAVPTLEYITGWAQNHTQLMWGTFAARGRVASASDPTTVEERCTLSVVGGELMSHGFCLVSAVLDIG
jgi:hypothetical protein